MPADSLSLIMAQWFINALIANTKTRSTQTYKSNCNPGRFSLSFSKNTLFLTIPLEIHKVPIDLS